MQHYVGLHCLAKYQFAGIQNAKGYCEVKYDTDQTELLLPIERLDNIYNESKHSK